MKKVLNFFCNTQNGEKVMQIVAATIMMTFLIGLLLNVPLLWMGKAYYSTWMDATAAYFFLPFGIFITLFLTFFVPYMSYIAGSENYKGSSNTRAFMRWMSVFCSIIPGAIIYKHIADELFIPKGIHNLAGILICGLLYLLIMRTILKKPFRTAQTYMPLA